MAFYPCHARPTGFGPIYPPTHNQEPYDTRSLTSIMRHTKSHNSSALSRRLNWAPSRDFARKNTAHAWTDGPPPATFTVR